MKLFVIDSKFTNVKSMKNFNSSYAKLHVAYENKVECKATL